MIVLIDELRLEHSSLSIAFENIIDLDITSPEGRMEFLSIRSALLSHLKREDDELYPKLREASSGNHRLKLVLDRFMCDLARITTALVLFLEKYAGEGTDPLMFKHDFYRLNTILNALIRQEERVIFIEYLNITYGRVA